MSALHHILADFPIPNVCILTSLLSFAFCSLILLRISSSVSVGLPSLINRITLSEITLNKTVLETFFHFQIFKANWQICLLGKLKHFALNILVIYINQHLVIICWSNS